MRVSLMIVRISAALVLFMATARATTVFPEERNCPVCRESFITKALGSYSNFGEPERDLSDSPVFLFGGVEMCPYCLFASLKSDFDDVSARERARLRTKTPFTRVTLQASEQAALLADPRGVDTIGRGLLNLWLARESYALRAADDKRDMRMCLQLYYASKRADHDVLLKYYRGECVEKLTLLLGDGTYRGEEKAVMTYLLGELTRLDGQGDKAIILFEEVMRLVKAPAGPQDENPAAYAWVWRWAFEQFCRIHFSRRPAKELGPFVNSPQAAKKEDQPIGEIQRNVAIQSLADRTDVDAWTILADYTMQDVKRLDELDSLIKLTPEKLKIVPRFWDWVQQCYAQAREKVAASGHDADIVWIRINNGLTSLFEAREWSFFGSEDDARQLSAALVQHPWARTSRQHAVQAGESLGAIGARNGTSVERLLELNPQITNADEIKPAMEIHWLDMPCGWSEAHVLANLDRLIGQGDANAIEFILRWLETTGKHSLKTHSFRIGQCLEALSKEPDKWKVPPKEVFSVNGQREVLWNCLAVVHGSRETVQRLLPVIASKNEAEVLIALQALQAIKSPLAKELVLGFLNTPDCDFMVSAVGHSYLSAVAAANDLPNLKDLAKALCPKLDGRGAENNMGAYRREDMESTIREVLLRDVLSGSLGK